MSGKVESFASSSYAVSTLSCDICHKYFNGKKPYNEHLQSNNHKKKLKEKALLDIASQESFKPQLQTFSSSGVYKDEDLEVKSFVDALQYMKLTENSETKNTHESASWNAIESPISSSLLFPKPKEKEHEPFYVECAVCQLFFTSEKSAYLHFNDGEHKRKVAHHREIEELYNSIKNIDIQEIVENLCEMPSLNPLDKNVKSNIANTATTNSRQRTTDASGSKLSLGDQKFKEKKLQPGCEICGITSFPSVVSSLNHLSTTEHCRKAAMRSEAIKLNSNISNELLSLSVDTDQKPAKNSHMGLAPTSSHIVSLNSDYFSRTCKQEKKSSDSISLNPIGYERKQKQHQQPNYQPLEKPICAPEMYNFDYNDKASAAMHYFPEILLDPVTQTPADCDLGGQYFPQKCVSDLPQKLISKSFPRLAATFPQNNIHTERKNLPGIQIISPDQDFSF